MNIILTEQAIIYLKDKLRIENEYEKCLSIYISIIYPYTKYAHVNISFCKEDDINLTDDLKVVVSGLNLYVDRASIELLDNSIVDFKSNNLIINAPKMIVDSYKDDSNLKSKIKNFFENEINVILSQHGGFIELVDISNNYILVIKFHGGCQGCGMVGYTLNNYIEKMIKKNFPQIKSIRDITSHEIKDNAYY